MAKQFRKWLALLLTISTVLGITWACRLHDDRIELEKEGIWQFYSINPETILDDLSQGNTDVFTLLKATPEMWSSPSPVSVEWSQDDFYQVAQAIHERSWGESLGDHNLYSMSFEMNCLDAGRGTFSEADFDSFKEFQQPGEEQTRIEHWIVIKPAENRVYTVEVKYQPNVNYKKPIDLTEYQITVDEGLQIAERNGGSEARLTVGNDCKISAFSPTVNGEGWEISYINYPENSLYRKLFSILIDPRSGKYKVLYPKPK